MVFAIEYDNNIQLCIFHTRLQQSEWILASDATIPIKGLSLDDVWNNIVAEIGGLSNDAEETLEQQIIEREEREKLHKQIEVLEKRCRLEKQTRKKYELHQQLLNTKRLCLIRYGFLCLYLLFRFVYVALLVMDFHDSSSRSRNSGSSALSLLS